MIFLLAILAWLITQVRPGTNTIGRESSPPRTNPTDTGQAFAVGITERGRTGQWLKFTSWLDFQRECGSRQNWTTLAWDAVESYFRFGGAVLYFVRVVGPGAVKAHVNLPDAVAAISLVAEAVGEGAWYNGVNVIVETDPANAAARRVRVTHDTDPTIIEASPYFATQQELHDWAANRSKIINLNIGVSALMPADGNYNLALGNDDRANIVDAQRIAGLAEFDPDLGPGQVCIPGATTAAAWDAVLTHAEGNNRSAVLDYPDTEDEATLTALADTARAHGRVGAGFGPWVVMPNVGGITKVVPPSLAVAARSAKQDSVTGGYGQNKPAAGTRNGRGILSGALDVSQSFSDPALRQRLNEAGVNLIRNLRGDVTIFGWRSLADSEVDVGWVNFGHRRMQTAIAAGVDSVMGEFMFDEIDGAGLLLGQLNGQIKGRVVQPFYDRGSLFGATPEDAYRIDTDSVNTKETIQNRELHAVVTVVESEFAEEITVEVVKKQITEGV